MFKRILSSGSEAIIKKFGFLNSKISSISSLYIDKNSQCTCWSNSVKSFRQFSSDPKKVTSNYIPFEDQKQVILDISEEKWNPLPENEEIVHALPYTLERGKNGVFDLDQVLEIIRGERGFDICVISIPKEIDYADYMVIASARNQRHLQALSTMIRKIWKSKKLKSSEGIPRIEGLDKNTEWVALDLCNIALHIFTGTARQKLDLEILWTVGPAFDDLTHAKDPAIVAFLTNFHLHYRKPEDTSMGNY